MGNTEAEFETPQGGGLQTAKDLFSGAVGGIAQVLIGTCKRAQGVAVVRE